MMLVSHYLRLTTLFLMVLRDGLAEDLFFVMTFLGVEYLSFAI